MTNSDFHRSADIVEAAAIELANKIDLHLALSESSPGFHLSEEELQMAASALRDVAQPTPDLFNRIATITIDDQGHRNSELQQVLVAGYVALKWALPLQGAAETIAAIAALVKSASAPCSSQNTAESSPPTMSGDAGADTQCSAESTKELFECREFEEDAFRSMEVQICGETRTVQFAVSDHGGDHPTSPAAAIDWGKAVDLARWIIAHTQTEPQAAPTARDMAAEPLEPVAWRWRFEDERGWTLLHNRPNCADDRDVICQPLYPSPLTRPDSRSAGDIDGYCSCGRHKANQCDTCLSFSSAAHAVLVPAQSPLG
jgi:hypothetical protein